MRHFDFSPLYRATVGFDQIAEMMDAQLHPIRAPDPWNSTNQDHSLQQRQSYLKPKKYHLLRIAHRSLLTKPQGLAES